MYYGSIKGGDGMYFIISKLLSGNSRSKMNNPKPQPEEKEDIVMEFF